MADFFDFDSLTQTNSDPFEDATSYVSDVDTRFYTLPKNKDGSGEAIICFIPDQNQKIFKKVFKFNISNFVSGKKRFANYFSPTTIGLPDPVQERWQKLWNDGLKDEAKKFARTIRYITNIKVIRDPLNPENNGKIFLYEMSQSLKEKIKNAVELSEMDKQLNRPRKEIFNPTKGWLMKLTCKKAVNGFTTYDDSEFFNVSPDDPRMADLIPYKDAQTAIDDIKANAHALDWFDKPENYKTYDELKEKLDWVYPPENASIVKEKRSVEPDVVSVPPLSADTSAQGTQAAPSVTTTVTPRPEQSTSADALIDSLLND